MKGLTYLPTLGSKKKDDIDFFKNRLFKVPQEFSNRNKQVLKETFTKVKDKCKVILEIGVARNGKDSSTYTFLELKNENCHYVGVDLQDKTFLKEEGVSNVHTLLLNSSNKKEVMAYVYKITGAYTIDFLFIDGWHSVTQVLKDWSYIEYLSENGVVMLHDTNIHPGPVELLKAINTTIYKVDQYFIDRKDDWGITRITKI